MRPTTTIESFQNQVNETADVSLTLETVSLSKYP